VLPPVPPLPVETVTRRLALIEEMSRFVSDTPVEAELGTIDWDSANVGTWSKLEWRPPVTENPAPGATEIWELYNVTADAHPIHIHEVVFEVVNRQDIMVFEDQKQVQINPGSPPTPPEPRRLASRTQWLPILAR
jgi:FtsP/CotA-like multicopper oxidase with cupredoxin domain